MLPRPPFRRRPSPSALRRSGGRALLRRARRPLPFWVAAAVLAAITGLTVARLVGSADAATARYGDARPALVATRDLPPGTVVAVDDAEVRLLPAALVPPGALDGPAVGRVVVGAVHVGEAVLEPRLAPGAPSPTAALLRPGTRGVAVPSGDGGLPLEVGDLVDVLATVGAGVAGDGDPTFPVARLAEVVAVGESAVTLAVAEGDAARVAYALATGAVTLVLAPPPG